MRPHGKERRNGPKDRLALRLFFLWLLGVAGSYGIAQALELALIWKVVLVALVASYGFGAITLLFERYKNLVSLAPVLRGQIRQLRRMFKAKHVQANILRKPARGAGEIGDFQLALRVLVNQDAVEIHFEDIPGPPISIPWSEIEYIRIVGEGHADELRAHLRVRQLPRMPIYLPWLVEFERFVQRETSQHPV